MNKLARFLPFLGWFPLRGDTAKADFLAGITVALVLIPQSMAYAQLAGLPPYFGLYAAFLPVAIASLFGSSVFLSTGPVAVVSLLTASALTPLAAPGSPQFIALAILLALLVGVTQLALGLFKLGVVVNFLSHPVIVGFTNAAALIIGLSQISKLFGVPMGRSESFMHDIAGVFAQIGDTHWPTLAMGLLALGLMWGIKKYKRKWPGVLIAVALTTTLSWAIGFEKNLEGRADQIADPALTGLVADLGKAQLEESRLAETKASLMVALKEARRDAIRAGEAARLGYELDLATIATTEAEGLTASLKKELRQVPVARVIDAQGATLGLYRLDQVPAGARTDGAHYSIRGVKGEGFKLVGGGEVVGRIPEGLPALALPSLSLDAIGSLLTAAIVISLVGFMEAISIAKALATKAKQKVDPNQELIGQGLANILGGFSQAFPASGSFSRSAVNFDAGARSGLSSVFTALFVLITLLFLTPLLYHLPQAVLAAIIIMAVIGLVNIEAVKHAWEASRHDGIAAIVTFVATLAFAPHLDEGILVGAGLAILLYLFRTMKPRVAILGRCKDGTLRDVKVHPDLPTSPHINAIRFDGSLYFANVSYFEDNILEAVAAKPDAKWLLVVGDGINQLDASGEEVVHHLVARLRDRGTQIVFSGLKKQILDVMRRTGLFDLIGVDNIFATEGQAIAAIHQRLGVGAEDDPFRAMALAGQTGRS